MRDDINELILIAMCVLAVVGVIAACGWLS